MRPVGLLLLPAGWFIVLSAIIMLGTGTARGAFVLAGVGIQLVGLVLLVRSHLPSKDADE